MKVQKAMKDFKAWAWSRPTYENPVWDKVDNVVDNALETAFGNEVVTNLAEKANKVLAKINR